jgi:hypothetical protein
MCARASALTCRCVRQALCENPVMTKIAGVVVGHGRTK